MLKRTLYIFVCALLSVNAHLDKISYSNLTSSMNEGISPLNAVYIGNLAGNTMTTFDSSLSFDNLHDSFKSENQLENQKFKFFFAISSDRAGRIDYCPRVERYDCLKNFKFRLPDGSCNNLNITWWGSYKTPYKRIFEPAYQNQKDSPRVLSIDGRLLNSPKSITDHIYFAEDKYKDLSHMFVTFSQFVMHDISKLAHEAGSDGEDLECTCGSKNKNCLTIPVSKRERKKHACMIQIRARDTKDDFDCYLRTREILNLANSWLDLSTIYGNSKIEESSLRSFYRGRLLVSYFEDADGPLLPSRCPSNAFKLLKKANVCFMSGDDRVNQYAPLTAMHTIWMREHNRIADELYKINPHWNDQRLFQEAKRILIAIYQNIVYWEWLPYLIGEDMHKIFNLDTEKSGYFTRYDEGIFPSTTIEFAAAAARFGHLLVRPYVSRVNEHYETMYNYTLRKMMFKPQLVIPDKQMDEFIIGLLNEPAYENQPHMNEQLTKWLIVDHGNKNPTRFYSLPALNLNRGREVGLAPYAQYRKLALLNYPYSFDKLTWIPSKQIKKLKRNYKYVSDIDLYVGGTVEYPVPGGVVGPTFAYIIARGFRDWKYGDRFFFENPPSTSPYAFTLKQLKEIRQVGLRSIICNSIGLKKINKFAFEIPESKSHLVSCNNVFQLDLNLFRDESDEDSGSYEDKTRDDKVRKEKPRKKITREGNEEESNSRYSSENSESYEDFIFDE